MASYFSSLLTTTTSRVASIRQNLLSSETDGDTEDDTHICRVLRAYYTEKGRSFPGWLPPDPKAPPPVVVAPIYNGNNGVGSRYGGGGGAMASGGSLSSLWDNNSRGESPVPQGEGSLRAGRGVRGGAGGAAARQNPFSRQQQQGGQHLGDQVQARPLPSQRAGSYQSSGIGGRENPGAVSASEKLRSRFKPGGGARSPAATESTPRMADVGRGNSYPSGGSSGGNYEDRFLPGNNGGYGGGGSEKPFVAATSPWASNEQEFSGGYGGGGSAAPGRERRGLPAGPGAGRRGMGLPSGPRGPR